MGNTQSSHHGLNTMGVKVKNYTHDEVRKHYDIQGELGEGVGGVAYLCQDKITKEVYACKSMWKQLGGANREELNNEVDIMNHLAAKFPNGHPNIVKLIRVFEEIDTIHLIIEYCKGGSLIDYAMTNKETTEEDATKILYGIMRAIQACHVANVMHMDVKLDNLLFWDDPKKRLKVKLIDYGVSTFIESLTSKVRGIRGTRQYLAPEVFRGHYGIEVDIWAAGICLYALLFGKFPTFTNEGLILSEQPILLQNNTPLSFYGEQVLLGMLNLDPKLRMTTNDFFQHEWVKGKVNEDEV